MWQKQTPYAEQEEIRENIHIYVSIQVKNIERGYVNAIFSED